MKLSKIIIVFGLLIAGLSAHADTVTLRVPSGYCGYQGFVMAHISGNSVLNVPCTNYEQTYKFELNASTEKARFVVFPGFNVSIPEHATLPSLEVNGASSDLSWDGYADYIAEMNIAR